MREVVTRNLRQQRPYARRLHRYVGIIEQSVEFIKHGRVLAVGHRKVISNPSFRFVGRN